ncbi:MAG: hypothetical protein PHT07_20965 [Paludibacter sp.]|nr:hypothetical protein [Paludibacter sp.]
MKRIFILLAFILISTLGFSQNFEGITGLKFLGTDTARIEKQLILDDDTIVFTPPILDGQMLRRYLRGDGKHVWTNRTLSSIGQAKNGLHSSSDTVKLGGPLTENTSIDINTKSHTLFYNYPGKYGYSYVDYNDMRLYIDNNDTLSMKTQHSRYLFNPLSYTFAHHDALGSTTYNSNIESSNNKLWHFVEGTPDGTLGEKVSFVHQTKDSIKTILDNHYQYPGLSNPKGTIQDTTGIKYYNIRKESLGDSTLVPKYYVVPYFRTLTATSPILIDGTTSADLSANRTFSLNPVPLKSDWNTTDTTKYSFVRHKPTSLPASDVYDWAKASTKPSYDWSEITGKQDTLFTTIAISDETTALTTGTSKVTFHMPVSCTLTKVRASVNTAPTGATLIFDINESGTSVLSTKLSIDASEKTSRTAASQAVISDSSIANDAEMTIDIDQIGSTIAGAGAKIILYYLKN